MDLPRRERELVVELEEGAVKLFLEPLTDEQYLIIQEHSRIEGEGDEQRLIFALSSIPGLFQDRFRRAEGITADGAPFDSANPDHVERIPQPWRVVALGRLIRYAAGLTKAEGGNSRPPRDPERVAATPSPDSPPVNAG